jgi:hypothetical protein
VPRCYKHDKYRILLAVRESPATKDVNMEVEDLRRCKPLPDNYW